MMEKLWENRAAAEGVVAYGVQGAAAFWAYAF